MLKMRTMAAVGVGYAAGYVAGAKAGRPAYDRISGLATKYLGASGIAVLAASGEAPAGDTSADLANEEIARLREQRTSTGPGRPDEGRQHAATVAPTP